MSSGWEHQAGWRRWEVFKHRQTCCFVLAFHKIYWQLSFNYHYCKCIRCTVYHSLTSVERCNRAVHQLLLKCHLVYTTFNFLFFSNLRLSLATLTAQWWKTTSCHRHFCRYSLASVLSFMLQTGTKSSFYYEYSCEVFDSVSLFEGTEAIPGLRSHSCRETGFTRGAIAPLACPVSTDPPPPSRL